MKQPIKKTNDIVVRKASFNDQECIVDLLESFYPNVADHWQKIFTPRPWTIEEDCPGYVLTDQNRIVGFLGTIFSEHETKKGKVKICNLTTWFVEQHYRQHSMMLFLKVMRIPNVSWTILTAAPHIYEWLTRTGFQILNDKQLVMLPIPTFFDKKTNKKIKIKEKNYKIDLKPDLIDIVKKHDNLNCKKILIEYSNEQCLCLLVLTRHKKIPLAKIYYVSNMELFKTVIVKIRFQLCLKLRVCYLQIEGDILQEKKICGIFCKKIYPPRLFKSNILTKEDIPILASELFVLGI